LIEAARRPREESLARVGRIEPVTQDLERHPASAFQVFGFIDGAHAAGAERRMMA